MPRLQFLAFALATAAFAGTAGAVSLSGSEIQLRAAGGEFRGDTHSSRGLESHIWRLAPDGSARAIVTIKKGLSALNSSSIETGDTGRWTIRGDTLCVDWSGENQRFSGCYAVEGLQGNHVRLVGPARWEGTLDR